MLEDTLRGTLLPEGLCDPSASLPESVRIAVVREGRHTPALIFTSQFGCQTTQGAGPFSLPREAVPLRSTLKLLALDWRAGDPPSRDLTLVAILRETRLINGISAFVSAFAAE